jgi:hypothetical protein
MSAELQILLVVLLPVAVGAAAAIYYHRKRGGSSSAEQASCPQDPGTLDRDATPLPGKQELPPLSESFSSDGAAATPHGSDEEVEQSTVALGERKDDAIDDEPASRAVSGPGPDERKENGLSIDARRAELVTPSAAVGHKESVAGDGREPEASPSHVESESASTPHIGETTKGGAPAVERDAAVSGEDVRVTEGLDKEQPALEEQPWGSPGEDEAPRLADREPCVPELAQNVLAGDEDLCADQGSRATEVPNASPEEEEVIEDPRVYRDEQPAGQRTEDRAFDTAKKKYDELDVDSPTIARLSEKKRARRREPNKYKGLVRVPPQPADVTPQPARPRGKESAGRERPLPIEVRLRFDRGGFCSVSLIAKRSPGLPEDLTAASPAGEVVLRAMQDEWYQDVVPEDIPHVLRDGTVWTYEDLNGQYTWSLSGRALYVLADRAEISGYVSQPCLDLGRDHVVLCHKTLRSQVQDAIRQTGAQSADVLDESFGAPPGWVVLRGVVPNTPVASGGGADIFNALRPVPKIEISLERGIRLRYTDWLHGHPPSIRVYGHPEHVAEVLIDGKVAACGSDGAYRVPGWDSLGPHTVWCSGTSRSYSIVPFGASWEMWEAYAFPVSPGETRRLTVCGPIVRAVAAEPSGAGASIPVPETNPVLLGPKPGQIAIGMRVSAQRGAPCLASPSFHPVWALPRDPLHCDKKTTRIVFVGGKETWESPASADLGVNSARDSDVAQWCRLILDASRKGMPTAPETESVRALWLSYKRLARQVWRSRR